jgi:hypothetical protein
MLSQITEFGNGVSEMVAQALPLPRGDDRPKPETELVPYVEDDVENEALGFIERNFYVMKRVIPGSEPYASARNCVLSRSGAQETGDHPRTGTAHSAACCMLCASCMLHATWPSVAAPASLQGMLHVRRPAIIQAAEKGRMDVVTNLLLRGVNPETEYEGYIPCAPAHGDSHARKHAKQLLRLWPDAHFESQGHSHAERV